MLTSINPKLPMRNKAVIKDFTSLVKKILNRENSRKRFQNWLKLQIILSVDKCKSEICLRCDIVWRLRQTVIHSTPS